MVGLPFALSAALGQSMAAGVTDTSKTSAIINLVILIGAAVTCYTAQGNQPPAFDERLLVPRNR